jgi:hypothetical protein
MIDLGNMSGIYGMRIYGGSINNASSDLQLLIKIAHFFTILDRKLSKKKLAAWHTSSPDLSAPPLFA